MVRRNSEKKDEKRDEKKEDKRDDKSKLAKGNEEASSIGEIHITIHWSAPKNH